MQQHWSPLSFYESFSPPFHRPLRLITISLGERLELRSSTNENNFLDFHQPSAYCLVPSNSILYSFFIFRCVPCYRAATMYENKSFIICLRSLINRWTVVGVLDLFAASPWIKIWKALCAYTLLYCWDSTIALDSAVLSLLSFQSV